MSIRLDHGEDSLGEIHDINVTPFIDVILVLLIIFMVAAPLSTVDLPIDLPSSTATPQKKPDKPTYVSIKPDLAVAIGENQVKRVDLVRTLDAMPDIAISPLMAFAPAAPAPETLCQQPVPAPPA